MPGGIADFGERPPVGQGMAEELIPAVTDGERGEAFATEELVGVRNCLRSV
jgi:hypothetical protein